MLRGFEHVGMATGNLAACLGFYVDLLGLSLALRKGQSGGGEVAFLDAGGGMLEVFAPAGPLAGPARILPSGEVGIRHLTFAVDDVDATYARLLAAGVPGVEAPRAAHTTELFRRVAFVRDPDGNVVELVERREKE